VKLDSEPRGRNLWFVHCAHFVGGEARALSWDFGAEPAQFQYPGNNAAMVVIMVARYSV
jgi:hypothetical protein